MALHRIITTFAAGEWSPLLDGRVDLESYQAGCRTLLNFIPRSYGGAFRRPGTGFMGETINHAGRTRVVPFNFSTTTSFIIEFSHLKLRFWSNGLLVPLVRDSPYIESHLFELQYVQVNDLMYITHPAYPVHKLSRIADDNWTLAPVEWDGAAFKDENITAVTITPGGTTGNITLTASAPIFFPEHVGSYWEISHRREDSFTELTGTTALDVTSPSLRILGGWELFTYGKWSGTLGLERSLDGTTWESLRTFTSRNGDHNVQATGNEEEQCWLRLKAVTAITFTDTPPFRAVIEAVDSKIHGVVKITGYTSPTVVSATVIRDLQDDTATTYWSEGAWSAHSGHPRAVTLFDQRLIFGGTRAQPQMIWGSVIGDFEDFSRSTLDDGAFAFQLAATEANGIQWLASQAALYIGTQGDEWIMSGGVENATITPTNVSARRQSRLGSAYMGAILVNDTMLFVQRNGRRLREFVYVLEKDGFASPDMTVRSEHITRGGIVQMAVSQQPDSVVWAVTGAGSLLTMTYERDQKAVAWSRHETDGAFESVAVIYGNQETAEGIPDEVWVVVRRTIGGATRRYIERLDHLGSAYDYSRPAQLAYVDSAVVYPPGPPADVRAGLGHLEGRQVQVLADGAVQPSRTVVGGQITQQAPSAEAVVGLGFESILQPNKVEVQMRDGSAQGRKFSAARAVIRFHRSSGCDVIHDPAADLPWDSISFRDTVMAMDRSVPLFDGDKEVVLEGRHARELGFAVRQIQPLPLNVLAIILKFEVHGS